MLLVRLVRGSMSVRMNMGEGAAGLDRILRMDWKDWASKSSSRRWVERCSQAETMRPWRSFSLRNLSFCGVEGVGSRFWRVVSSDFRKFVRFEKRDL